MFAFQRESSLSFVVEGFSIQTGKEKFLSVVLNMATRAVHLIGRLLVRFGVIPLVGLHAALDFCVAFQALEAPVSCAQIMTVGTLGHTLPLLVGT